MIRHVVALASLLAITGSVSSAVDVEPYRITRIEAHLYYQETGTFDPANIVSDSSHTLWNTIIGEGAAQTPSGATLVLVEVNGSWLAGARPPRLRVTVQLVGGTVLLRQIASLGELFSEERLIKVPFIAFGTGCGETRVTAALLDARGSVQSSLTRTIRFQCGE